jgi:hypothetical protein
MSNALQKKTLLRHAILGSDTRKQFLDRLKQQVAS